MIHQSFLMNENKFLEYPSEIDVSSKINTINTLLSDDRINLSFVFNVFHTLVIEEGALKLITEEYH